MARIIDLAGKWLCKIEGLEAREAVLPGTLDENGIGFPDAGDNLWKAADVGSLSGDDGTVWNSGEVGWKEDDILTKPVIRTRLTRNFTYEGPAFFTREIELEPKTGERYLLFAERSRKASLRVNGREVPCLEQGSVSTPYIFEITPFLQAGTNALELTSDNSYPDWPRDAIVFSSAATDETQTNWSGFLGRLEILVERSDFIAAARVYPGEECAAVEVELDLAAPKKGSLTVASEAFAAPARIEYDLPAGRACLKAEGVRYSAGVRRWDEEEGNLYTAAVSGEGLEETAVRFGVRTFGAKDGRLVLNGRRIFIRSEANCCVFPETGHMPMTVEGWKEVLAMFRSYGVNMMRFHSHTPPEAAFAAADEMGMLMEPELSHWNPRTAFEDEKSWNYYRMELREVLRALANHPSFVMLSFGNELGCGALGTRRMTLLLNRAREMDPTRLFEEASNPYLGSIGPNPQSGYYASHRYCKKNLRATSAGMVGYLNEKYPSAKENFSAEIAELRAEYQGPVFGFEVGQYEVLPDFAEWDGHKGVTRPDNYRWIEANVRAMGFADDWKRRVEATGELSLLGYREEVESILRTPEMSGLSLLGIQDFPGQGTALVGMLNAHLRPKPYSFAQPERFHAFFRAALPLALLEKYTYTTSEELRVPVRFANYGRGERRGAGVVRLMRGGETVAEAALSERVFPSGELTEAGEAVFPLEGIAAPARLDLVVELGGEKNAYPVWVYTENQEIPAGDVLVTQSAGEAFAALEAGRKVFLTPTAVDPKRFAKAQAALEAMMQGQEAPAAADAGEEHFPGSVQAQFSTDFWSVGTFSMQSGFMGLMMDPSHPAFASFPTEGHTNWQWWPMCLGRAFPLPKGRKAIVTGLDCYARMRSLAMLMEARVGKGSLVLSGMGLCENRAYPEARALTRSILEYMNSPAFQPDQELTMEELRAIVR